MTVFARVARAVDVPAQHFSYEERHELEQDHAARAVTAGSRGPEAGS